jgi:hypothetical protein
MSRVKAVSPDRWKAACNPPRYMSTWDASGILDLPSATYTVSVHEATTGKDLDMTLVSSDDDTCPMFMSFDDDSQKTMYDAVPSKDDLVAFVKPFVQP